MFSKTCEYALRAVIFIAQKSQAGDKVGIKEIAAGINSPEYFIAKILQDLGKKGIIKSVKGPNGGFFMDKENLSLSLADVVKAFDGEKIFTGCALGLPECSEELPCPLHHEFKVIRKALREMLENSEIETFVNDLDAKLTFLKTFH